MFNKSTVVTLLAVLLFATSAEALSAQPMDKRLSNHVAGIYIEVNDLRSTVQLEGYIEAILNRLSSGPGQLASTYERTNDVWRAEGQVGTLVVGIQDDASHENLFFMALIRPDGKLMQRGTSPNGFREFHLLCESLGDVVGYFRPEHAPFEVSE